MMKEHPQICLSMWSHARTLLGVTDGPSEALPQSSFATPLVPDTVVAEQANRAVGRSKKVIDLSVSDLKGTLYQIDKIALSPFALRAMAKRGARDASKTNLTQLLEYLTGIAPHFVLDPPFNIVSEFQRYASQIANNMGQLSRTLELPPDWDTDGHWKFSVQNHRSLWLVLKRTQEARTCTWPHPLRGKSDVLTLQINMNWSESGAQLKQIGTMNVENVKALFASGVRVSSRAQGGTESNDTHIGQLVASDCRLDEPSVAAPGCVATLALELDDANVDATGAEHPCKKSPAKKTMKKKLKKKKCVPTPKLKHRFIRKKVLLQLQSIRELASLTAPGLIVAKGVSVLGSAKAMAATSANFRDHVVAAEIDECLARSEPTNELTFVPPPPSGLALG